MNFRTTVNLSCDKVWKYLVILFILTSVISSEAKEGSTLNLGGLIGDKPIKIGSADFPYGLRRGTNISHFLSQTKKRGLDRKKYITEDDIIWLVR